MWNEVTRQHPDWITAYLDAVVSRSEAPEHFHFWIASWIIGGALRRRVFIEMEAFQWYPNQYIILVGPPGTVKKSSTINIGARLLRAVPHIKFGSDIATWEGFMEELEEADDDFSTGNPTPGHRFSFNDTIKRTKALNFAISEWGTFFDPDNRQEVNVLTECYDGKSNIPLHKKTKTQGENTITNPFVNMLAGTTPDWLADNFKGRLGGWGFSSRCIFLHAFKPERYIAYLDEEWRGQFRTAMDNFLSDLIEISQLQGQVTISPEARDYGRDWYEKHMQRKAELDSHPHHDPWLSYYLARKFDHAHKLAITLCASRRDSNLTITMADLMVACVRCDEVELELSNIFGDQRTRQQSRISKLNADVWRAIERMITQNKGGIPERAAFQFVLRYMSYGEMKQFFDQWMAAGILGRVVDDGQAWLTFGPDYVASPNERPH